MLRQHPFNFWLVSLLLLALTLPVTPVFADSPVVVSSTGSGQLLYFKETGHTLAYNFRVFWEKNGGLAILGFPITEAFMENGWPTQYFERASLEWHANTNLVQGGLLGRWALPVSPDQPALQPVGSSASKDVLFFSETKHSLGGGFKDFWLKRGGLAVFGFPLSEEFEERNPQDGKLYTVQYFERARFEYHPELPLQYQVELGQLGRQYLTQSSVPKEALTQVKDPETAWAGLKPTRVRVPRIEVDAEVSEGGFSLNAWDVPRYSAAHYWPISGFPGSIGNIILAAHSSFKDYLFYNLPKVKLDDEIIVSTSLQERHYKVSEILTVKPNDTWVMGPSDNELLTLITCVPYGVYSDCLIVRALPLLAT